MTKREIAVLRWIPAILLMVGIFIASSTPSSQIPTFGSLDYLVKKGGHFLAYAALGISFHFAQGKMGRNSILIAILLAFLYACTDELHQRTTSGRHPSPIDVGIDTLGAAVGVFLWTRLLIKHPRWLGPESEAASGGIQK